VTVARDGGHIKSDDCSTSKPFVCSVAPLDVPPDNKCPKDHYIYKAECYRMATEKRNFLDATVSSVFIQLKQVGDPTVPLAVPLAVDRGTMNLNTFSVTYLSKCVTSISFPKSIFSHFFQKIKTLCHCPRTSEYLTSEVLA
jgi:hypothetical protein